MKFKDLQTDDLGQLVSLMDDIRKEEENGFKQQWGSFNKKCIAYMNGENPNSATYNGGTYTTSPLLIQNKTNLKRGADQHYQTNEISPAARTLVSYMTRQKPTIDVFSMDDDDIKANAVAKVARQVSDACYDLDNELGNNRDAANWLLATGTVFRKDFYNLKKNRNEVAILSGYQISFDYSITNFDNLRWIKEDYISDVDWVRAAYTSDQPGYTNKAQDVEDDGEIGEILRQLEDMKTSVPYRGQGKRKLSGKVLVSEMYIEPTDEYPQGRFIVKAGNEIVYATMKGMDNPYYLGNGDQMWHPYTPCIYEKYVGRAFGKGLVEQGISIQKRLNEINGAILKNANTVAKPNIFTLEGQLKRNYMNGEMANIYTYEMVPNGEKPYIEMGTPLPQQFFNERGMLVDSLVRIFGTNFVMQGQPPTGVSAASAIGQLLENANNQHAPAMQNFATFIQKGLTKKLRILKKFNTEPNKELNQYLRMMAKKSYNTEFQIFVGATDLADDLYVKIEPSTMIPKSEVAKNDLYQTIIKEGILAQKLQEDSPRGEKLVAHLFEKMGLDKLPTEANNETKKAEWENQRILLGLPVEVSEYDVGAVHLQCHVGLIQNPDFLEGATDEQKLALQAHIDEHNQAEAEKMAEQQEQMLQQQLLTGVPPGGETPSSGAVSTEQPPMQA